MKSTDVKDKIKSGKEQFFRRFCVFPTHLTLGKGERKQLEDQFDVPLISGSKLFNLIIIVDNSTDHLLELSCPDEEYYEIKEESWSGQTLSKKSTYPLGKLSKQNPDKKEQVFEWARNFVKADTSGVDFDEITLGSIDEKLKSIEFS